MRHSQDFGFIIRLILSAVMLIVMSACVVIDERDTETNQQGVIVTAPSGNSGNTDETVSDTDQSGASKDNKASTGGKVAGATIGALVTIYVVTDFIKDKVVPAAFGLAVAYLIVKSADESD